MSNYANGEGTQTNYEYECKLCGKKGTSRQMTHSRELGGMVHRKCLNKYKKGKRMKCPRCKSEKIQWFTDTIICLNCDHRGTPEDFGLK